MKSEFTKLFESIIEPETGGSDVKTIDEFKKQGYQGPDASLDISLFEYGLIWKLEGDDYKFIHPCSHGKGYTTSWFKADTDPLKEFNWVKFDEVAKTHGVTTEELLSEPLPHLVYDLVNSYGVENVFGSDYYEGFEVQDPSKVE